MSVTFRATGLSARPLTIEKRTAAARSPNGRMRAVRRSVVSLMKCAVDSQCVAGYGYENVSQIAV
jgi:hypothetical protein